MSQTRNLSQYLLDNALCLSHLTCARAILALHLAQEPLRPPVDRAQPRGLSVVAKVHFQASQQYIVLYTFVCCSREKIFIVLKMLFKNL